MSVQWRTRRRALNSVREAMGSTSFKKEKKSTVLNSTEIIYWELREGYLVIINTRSTISKKETGVMV